MADKTDALEAAIINAIFANTPMSYGTTLHVSLHTGDPGEAGDQTTNECAYTGYARQPVAVPAGWTNNGSDVENANDILFPEATGGSETVTHFGIGTDLSGVGTLLYKSAVNSSLPVSSGVQPKFAAGDLTAAED